jgi:uncharacterized membrane protein
MTPLSFSLPRIRRFLLLRTELDRIMTASMLFSCTLAGLRILHTGRLTFLSMIWNLFLAYIPYAISTALTVWRKPIVGPAGARPGQWFTSLMAVLRILSFFIWLLFIPNSFYILTDLYHLADNHRNSRVPEWFDLALILSFAWNGLLLGILSTRHIEKLLAPEATALGRWLFLYPVMWLNALGIYIGRYLRYNSWDIITNPIDLFADILTMLLHPLRYRDAWGMVFCYSILLTLIYKLMKKGARALS